MKSIEKYLAGTGAIMKDNSFKESFDLSFRGHIIPVKFGNELQNTFRYSGRVKYNIKGNVPLPLRFVPSSSMKIVIGTIQKAIETYAISEMTTKISAGFENYSNEQKYTRQKKNENNETILV